MFLFRLSPLILVLLLSGCQGVFELNLLAGADAPVLPAPAALKTASVSTIKNLLNSPKTMALLKADPEARAAASENLEAVMAQGTPAEKAEAASVYLDLQLKGTGALDASNALVTELLPLLSGSGGGTLDLADLGSDPEAFQALLQDVFGEDPAQVEATLEGLQNMIEGYTTLNENGGLDGISGDHLAAAPLAVLADILIDGSSAEDLTNFITGETSTLENFDLSQVESGIADLQDVLTGGTPPPGSDYGFLADLPGIIP